MRVHYRTSRLSRIPPCPATRKRSDHQSLLNSRRKLGFSARSTADDRPVSRYVSFFGFPTVICSRSKSSSSKHLSGLLCYHMISSNHQA
ncbi:hypothetical protein BDW71DRAFT_189747 [Aspergillus fruticulosus]